MRDPFFSYIAHRGNVFGPNPERENQPSYIDAALKDGYDVEIDAWFQNGVWILGHDAPQYEVDFDFINRQNLWVHCKSYEALQEISVQSGMRTLGCDYFYHTDEDYVLTYKDWIWAYPGKPGGYRTICVMPEWNGDHYFDKYAGICSDFIGNFRD